MYAPIRPDYVYCHLRPNKSYHKPAFISYCIHCNRVTYGLLLILIRTIHFSCCPLVFCQIIRLKYIFICLIHIIWCVSVRMLPEKTTVLACSSAEPLNYLLRFDNTSGCFINRIKLLSLVLLCPKNSNVNG